eukprot:CAMPEP_0178922360 /NCGR_PEP_ID=MMETSP0786-20121207/16107_1 /TAXON_ID=186022 /ORGANISM="Thalassionema frauenfeldii, Strain CCMP 1798" /LENGTH=220 /DNA_ID=CAMNT_0020596709 /DNA_START=69 /DNA_END=731 /DNA_ORIENTATION=+
MKHSSLSYLSLQVLQCFVFIFVRQGEGAFSTILSAGYEECFIIHAPSPATISGNFDMLDDELSPDPVSVRLENSQTVLWSSRMGDSEGIFEIVAEEGGRHQFCLENGKRFKSRDGLERTIGWAVRVKTSHPRSLRNGEQGPDAERAASLADQASELQEAWETLLDHYGFLRTREGIHKILSDQIMGRVVHWTMFEGVTLALIAGGQILYLRKFMETRRYL